MYKISNCRNVLNKYKTFNRPHTTNTAEATKLAKAQANNESSDNFFVAGSKLELLSNLES